MSSISNTRLIISLLQQIPRHPNTISVNELREKILDHEGLDIPIRNMQRYLSQVKGHFGLDCTETDPGKAKMWFVENVERRDPSRNNLPASQAISYLIAQKILAESAPKSVAKQMEALFNQAQHSLKSKGIRFAAWDKKVKIINSNLPIVKQSLAQDIIDTLLESVLAETQVEIIYKSEDDENQKKYTVSPLGIIIKGGSHYLICADERSTTKSTMNLPVREIIECQVTGNKIDESYFVGLKRFDLDVYCDNANLIGRGASEKITLIAEVTRELWEELKNNPISENQKLDTKTDGDAENKILSATLPNSDSLKRWILGCAESITVLEPISLREEVQACCVKAANNYRALSEEELKRLG